MAIVFGTRLAGPGRSSRYDPGSNAAWKTVNGVPIPPRPEEPDNCCMSGCVHCVWDDYRDEMEEWAALLAEAKAKGPSKKSVVPGAIPKMPDDAPGGTSMDDDGGGSEANWSLPGTSDDLFADIPVGIREFMKTEKRLKQIHQQGPYSTRPKITPRNQEKMSLSKSETDIILNKANIALARSQRLVASWLPVQQTSAEQDLSNAKTDEELQREEDEVFTAVPERLGLGAPLPTKAADGSWNRTELDSNDQLRRQLLGRNYKKVMAEKARQKNTEYVAGSSTTTTTTTNSTYKGRGPQQRGEKGGAGAGDSDDDDDDDEEEGRTASIGKKGLSNKRKVVTRVESTRTEDGGDGSRENGGIGDDEDGEKAPSQPAPRSKGRKKATSFLDEILAERSKKRRKQ
ncbi:hypothetical protein BJX65DRAFT_321967 [Aspergillus insuetus]